MAMKIWLSPLDSPGFQKLQGARYQGALSHANTFIVDRRGAGRNRTDE